jgi:DNA modification methylase
MTPYYEESGITIYHGDCREVLPDLPKVNLVLTDPPYGIGRATRGFNIGTKGAMKRDYGVVDWDVAAPSSELLHSIIGQSEQAIIFGGNYFALPPSSCWLVWDKDNTGKAADCELAWTNLPGAVRKFKWLWNGLIQEHDGRLKELRQHPTQKPLVLMRWCLSIAKFPKSVMDPFMGSGTTLLACKSDGCACVGIEREERYCEIAVNRLRQEVLPFNGFAYKNGHCQIA